MSECEHGADARWCVRCDLAEIKKEFSAESDQKDIQIKENKSAMNEPIFKKRHKTARYQVRFWAYPPLYSSFKNVAEDQGFILQDVFNEFMHWFIERYKPATTEGHHVYCSWKTCEGGMACLDRFE